MLLFLVCFPRLGLALLLGLPLVELEVIPPLQAPDSLAQLGLYRSFRVHLLPAYFLIAHQEDYC